MLQRFLLFCFSFHLRVRYGLRVKEQCCLVYFKNQKFFVNCSVLYCLVTKVEWGNDIDFRSGQTRRNFTETWRMRVVLKLSSTLSEREQNERKLKFNERTPVAERAWVFQAKWERKIKVASTLVKFFPSDFKWATCTSQKVHLENSLQANFFKFVICNP